MQESTGTNKVVRARGYGVMAGTQLRQAQMRFLRCRKHLWNESPDVILEKMKDFGFWAPSSTIDTVITSIENMLEELKAEDKELELPSLKTGNLLRTRVTSIQSDHLLKYAKAFNQSVAVYLRSLIDKDIKEKQ